MSKKILEKLEQQKIKLLQKQEALKAEAKRISRAEASLCRKTRTGHLVALGLIVEAYLLSPSTDNGKVQQATIDYYKSLIPTLLKRDVDKKRVVEILAIIQEKRNQQQDSPSD